MKVFLGTPKSFIHRLGSIKLNKETKLRNVDLNYFKFHTALLTNLLALLFF